MKTKGFNLLELMVVLALVSILLAAGTPALSAVITRYSISAETARLVSSINLARSQAVNKRQVVTLAQKSTVASNWTDGWTIFSDAGREGNQGIHTGIDSGKDTLLKNLDPSSSRVSIKSSIYGNHWISFSSGGTLKESGDIDIAICSINVGSSLPGKLITINRVGRATVSTIDTVSNSIACNPT